MVSIHSNQSLGKLQVESESNLTGKKREDLWLKAFDDYVSICGGGSEEPGCGRGGGGQGGGGCDDGGVVATEEPMNYFE